MEKEEMIETIKALIQYHKGLWDWYWNKNQRDKRLEHFYKMQVLEDLLQLIEMQGLEDLRKLVEEGDNNGKDN